MSQVKSSFDYRTRNSGSSFKVSQSQPQEILSDQVNIPYSDQSESESKSQGEDEIHDSDIVVNEQLSDASISPNNQSHRSNTLSYESKTLNNGETDKNSQFKTQKVNQDSKQNSNESLDRSYTWNDHSSLNKSLLSSQFDLDSTLMKKMKGISVYQEAPDDLLKSLLLEEKMLKEKLQKLIDLHKQITNQGSSSKKIRDNILNCFKSLTLLYQAIIGLYEKEKQRKTEIFMSLRNWENSKKKIMNEIEEIADPDNGEGLRLKQLIEETNVVDCEIQDLEKRLKQLKDKKNVLKTEIIQSQSIIESRTSSYLDELKTIEQTETEALRHLNSEGLISNGILSLHTQNNSMFSLLIDKLSNQTNQQSLPNSGVAMEAIKRQLESNKDSVSEYQNKEQIYSQGCLIWADIGHLLQNLENELSDVIKHTGKEFEVSGTKEKIEKALQKTLNVLQEREKNFTHISDELRVLLESEIDIIWSSLRVLNTQSLLPTRESSKLPKKEEWFSFSKAQVSEPTVTSVLSPLPITSISTIGGSSNQRSFGSTLKDKLMHNNKNNIHKVPPAKTEKTD